MLAIVLSYKRENMKTHKSSFILGLLLVALGCSHLDSPKERAYQSLDTVIRLYKAGVDSIDAELLAPALSYFPNKGDASTKGRLWFHAGLISYHQGEYDKAIVSFEKALRQAQFCGDRNLEGRVCRAMADTYSRTYNVREDTLYMRRAYLAFDADEDTLFRAEVALRLVAAYMNARKWDQADTLLKEVLPFCLRNPVLFGPGMIVNAFFQLNAPSGDPEAAIRSFEEAASAGYPLTDDNQVDMGYALYLTGREKQAFRLWDSLAELHPEGLLQLEYRKYNRYCLEGESWLALQLLESSAARQDSMLRIQASEAVSRAQRDYQEAVAEGERLIAAHERDRKRALWVISLLVVVLFGLIAFVFFQEQRERMDTIRQALEESQRIAKRLKEAEHRHISKIEYLRRNAQEKASTLEEIRSDYLSMLRDGYRRLGRLFEDKQFAETQVKSETVLYRRVCETLKDIDGDSKGFQRLQNYIEDHLGQPIASLRQDIPSLSEKDIQLFCYLVIGYDAPLIAALMGMGKDSTIHSWKSRLTNKIRRLPVSKAKRYLDLIR